MLYTKYQGSSRFLQEDLKVSLFTLYKSGRALFYTRGIIWTFFLATNQNHFNNVGRGPGIIPVEFGQISISGSREELVWGSSFPNIIQCKIVTPGHCTFRQEDFWKLHFENLFFDPVTYLSNQIERFEQLW